MVSDIFTRGKPVSQSVRVYLIFQVLAQTIKLLLCIFEHNKHKKVSAMKK